MARALETIIRLIPDGAEVMTGSSRTLEEVGFVELLKWGSHPWKNLKNTIQAESDPLRQLEPRKRATLSQYFLGTVYAVAKTGVVTVSGGGSQLGAHAHSAGKVICVAGTQKIVATLEDGLRHVREHSLPLEDARMKQMGYPGSEIWKLLIVEGERPDRIHMVFIGEGIRF
jgi:L-lactate utilization protein LutC